VPAYICLGNNCLGEAKSTRAEKAKRPHPTREKFQTSRYDDPIAIPSITSIPCVDILYALQYTHTILHTFDMNARLSLLQSMLSPRQLYQLQCVKGALDRDPTCLDRKKEDEKCIQGVSSIEDGDPEGA
jgi:hypothetical protein